ncbi:MAG TPA: triphosphoribosyl-dephospho-CoA synthase [Rubrobacteraceae bacterium]|nr:triphosphoribosyl-dephospho-CoA synthase [Rubrobacteraceae bacterium]
MEPRELIPPVPETQVSACAVVALTTSYSAPMPGMGSRYVDGTVAHEKRLLTITPVGEALAGAGRQGVGETVLRATLGSRRLAGFDDIRAAGYLAPLARAALLGEPTGRILSRLGAGEVAPFASALEAAEDYGPLAGALAMAQQAGRETTLRDAVRFASGRDPLAREYVQGYEITGQLARPALLSALSRAGASRAALVQSYLEVLSEVPDLDVVERAGRREAEDVSRMAHGVLKAGGVFSGRGLQGVANLDGLLRDDPRLAPSATEPPVTAAAFLTMLEYGVDSLVGQLRPATGGNRGR